MKFSTIICTHNPNSFFNKQISSIISSFQISRQVDFEILISDDSDLDTLKYELPAESSYLKGPKQGKASTNFLNAIRYVQGDWIFFSDQDDIWVDIKVNEYLDVISKLDDSIPQIIFSNASLINEKGFEFSNSFFDYQGLSTSYFSGDDILLRNCVQGATLCINREMINLILDSLDGESLDQVVMHDWWIAILAKYCGQWTFINKPLLQYRQHENNVVGAVKKGGSLHNFLKNPKEYYYRVINIKKQYELWCKVSERLGKRSRFSYERVTVNSMVTKIKLLIIRIL